MGLRKKYVDVNIGQLENSDGNVNVSLAWLRENTYTPGTSYANTLGTLQELELRVFSNTQTKGVSARTNTGKQMVYFAASPYEHIVRVTKASSNEKAVRYAFAWSTEDTAFGGYNYNVTATPTDLGYSDSTFSYTTLRLYDNNELANNKTLYVQIRKHNNSGIVFTSQLFGSFLYSWSNFTSAPLGRGVFMFL